MKVAGKPSWQIRIDEPEDLHVVLFVRDSCRLEIVARGAPGSLTPAVPDLSAGLSAQVRKAASRAWPEWWTAALDAHRTNARPLPDDASIDARFAQLRRRHGAVDRPGFSSLHAVPELQQAACRAVDAFGPWWSPPHPAKNHSDPHQRSRRDRRGLGMPGVKGELIDLHHGRGTEQSVVRQIERDLHRPARPFDLSIEVLAVTAPPVIAADPHYAVISAGLLADEHTYHDWLLATLRPLA